MLWTCDLGRPGTLCPSSLALPHSAFPKDRGRAFLFSPALRDWVRRRWIARKRRAGREDQSPRPVLSPWALDGAGTILVGDRSHSAESGKVAGFLALHGGPCGF